MQYTDYPQYRLPRTHSCRITHLSQVGVDGFLFRVHTYPEIPSIDTSTVVSYYENWTGKNTIMKCLIVLYSIQCLKGTGKKIPALWFDCLNRTNHTAGKGAMPDPLISQTVRKTWRREGGLWNQFKPSPTTCQHPQSEATCHPVPWLTVATYSWSCLYQSQLMQPCAIGNAREQSWVMVRDMTNEEQFT